MNRFWKLIFSIMGAANVVITFFAPIAIVLLWINLTSITGVNATMILVTGGLASMFRGIKLMMGWNR